MTQLSHYNSNRNSKYLTIDPLILETLNLNERRMNHILDILHGKNGNQRVATKAAQQIDKSLSRSYSLQTKKSFQKKSSQNNNNMTFDTKSDYNTILPTINQAKSRERVNKSIVNLDEQKTRRKSQKNQSKDKNYSTIDQSHLDLINKYKHNTEMRQKQHKYNKSKLNVSKQKKSHLLQNEQDEEENLPINTMIRKSSARHSMLMDESRVINQIIVKDNQKNSFKLDGDLKQVSNDKKKNIGAVRNRFKNISATASLKQLSPQTKLQSVNQNQLPTPLNNFPLYNFKQKTNQLISDYMGDYTLKKARSMQVLNPKDVYRLEIEQILQQLTPLQKIEQTEKRMKRIKRRYQHLKKFDKNYYSKLNEMDLIAL